MYPPRQIFVSPHLDDAVYSCTPIIRERVKQGFPVCIWTVMAGVPTRRVGFSRLAQRLSAQDASASVRTRQREDHEAARKIGAKIRHFDLLDGIYRNDVFARPYYPELRDLFNGIDLRELALVNVIRQCLRQRLRPDDVLFCPSAQSGHVDHVMVRLAVETFAQDTFLYDEFPYTLNRGEPQPEDELRVWAELIETYRSQWPLIFPHGDHVERLRHHRPRIVKAHRCHPAIPRTLHLVWVGDQPMPSSAEANLKRWRRLLNCNWTIKLWTNAELTPGCFPPAVLERMAEAPHGIQKADILRYQILAREGGWYFDLDFKPLQDIEPIALALRRETLILCQEDSGLHDKVSNGFFACSPSNPTLLRIAAEVLRQPLNIGDRNMAHIVAHTGPLFFRSMIDADQAIFLPPRLFYPVFFSEIPRSEKPDMRGAFAYHRWNTDYRRNASLYFNKMPGDVKRADIKGYGTAIIVFCFVRDEPELMMRWIAYHAAIVGMRNLVILDHGSGAESTSLYQKYTDSGLTVYDVGEYDFSRKGQILSQYMREYQGARLLVPLDADEFICTEDRHGMNCHPAAIRRAFARLPQRPFVFKFGTFDVCNRPDVAYQDPLVEMTEFHYFPPETKNVFSTQSFSKCFYPGKWFVSTDDGNHLGVVESCEGEHYSSLALVHFHTRGYDHFVRKHRDAIALFRVEDPRNYVAKRFICHHWIERSDAIRRGEGRDYFIKELCALRGNQETAFAKRLNAIARRLSAEALAETADIIPDHRAQSTTLNQIKSDKGDNKHEKTVMMSTLVLINYMRSDMNETCHRKDSSEMPIPQWATDQKDILNRLKNRAKLKICCKTLSDLDSIKSWVDHHAPIVGASNLIIADNGSLDSRVIEYYKKIESEVTIFQFSGVHNEIHCHPRFEPLYNTIKQTTKFFLFADVDERLIGIDGDSWV
ncbi:MAG TPA: hypothetical protein DCS43_08610, partial [Verrucomicrobia bacterium]|nr:hypothetical protein [Verrucomicrobiota bacterium]